jgi:hypothetical protein
MKQLIEQRDFKVDIQPEEADHALSFLALLLTEPSFPSLDDHPFWQRGDLKLDQADWQQLAWKSFSEQERSFLAEFGVAFPNVVAA